MNQIRAYFFFALSMLIFTASGCFSDTNSPNANPESPSTTATTSSNLESKNEKAPISNPDLESAQATRDNQEKTILALGDSLTSGYILPLEDSYPSILEERLIAEGYDQIKVINAGINGETTAGLVRRLDWVSQDEPDIVILASGANDALNALPVADTENNLRQAIEFFQERDIEVIFAGIQAPNNQGPEFVSQFNPIYPRLAEEYDLIFLPLFWQGIQQNSEYMLEDGIHPNRRGYTKIVESIWPLLEPLLAE
jgi:acyl-CoA thioesterase-1